MDITKIGTDLLDIKEIEKQPLQQPNNLYPEIKYEIPQIKLLRDAFEQRWRSLATRSERIGISMPDKEALWKKVIDCWNGGFKCDYCGNKMKIIESPPSSKTFTIEHELAIHNGGDNSLQNVFIICKDCNTKKNTLCTSMFHDVLNGKKYVIPGLSVRLSDFFKINRDGWTSEYLCVTMLLRHLGRRSRSLATRSNYLQHIRSFCLWARLKPDELTQLPKQKVEDLAQQFADTYNTAQYSRRTANNIITIIRSFYKVNGYKGQNELDIEGYFTSTRYRKTNEYVPLKQEIYLMSDAAGSLRNRAMILFIHQSGLRNSTLRALRYGDVKNELLQGISIIKIPVYPAMKEYIADACKNSLPYYSFIGDSATETLRRYLQDRTDKYGLIKDNDPLFASDYNQVDRDIRSTKFMTARQVQKIIKISAKLSGIEQWNDVKPHSIRKSYESVLRSETVDGNRLDTKVQEFLMGHILPGCQDNYFDASKIEELRLEYSKLKFGRVVVENKFHHLRRVVADAFSGSGEDVEKLLQEYVDRKQRLKKSLAQDAS